MYKQFDKELFAKYDEMLAALQLDLLEAQKRKQVIQLSLESGEYAFRLPEARVVIEEEPVPCDGQTLSITASIGVSTLPHPNNETRDHEGLAQQLTRTADEALYQAKENGRNQVVVSDA